MISSELIQTKGNFTKKYELKCENKLIGTAEVPISLKRKIEVNSFHQKFILQFEFLENILGKFKYGKNAKILPFQIYNDNNILIGSLCKRQTKLFFGYTFYELHYEEDVFYFYEVGLGKKGVKIPMYNNHDIQVALIEKDNTRYDNKSRYHLTSIDKNYQRIAFMWSIYYDIVTNSNNEVSVKSKETMYEYTLNKELKKKYNPNFKG